MPPLPTPRRPPQAGVLRTAVYRKNNMVEVSFFAMCGHDAMAYKHRAADLLVDLMPIGMVGIDGDEHVDAAMRVAASDGDRRNAVDVE